MSNNQNEDVEVAISLLRDALVEEETRIWDVGAKAMKAHSADVAKAVLSFAKELKGFEKKLQGLGNEWETLRKLRDAATPEVQEILGAKLFGGKFVPHKKGFHRKVMGKLAPKTNFVVEFADGCVVNGGKAAIALADAIDRLGAERVMALGIKAGGEPLVQKKKHSNYPWASHQITGGYFVQTHCDTATKVRYVKAIAQALKQEVKITVY